jgi:DNA-binding GntR family transcriptional regulator
VATNPPVAPIASPLSRSDLVAEAITEAILRGDLRPGQPLVERELAGFLGVSKTPVREALKRLSGSGLITTNAYRGTVVRAVDRGMVRTVYEVRLLLEPAAVRRAVPGHNEKTLAAARHHLVKAAAAAQQGDNTGLSLANRRFHRQLYEPCDNVVLRSFLDNLDAQIALISVVCWQQRATWAEEARQHEAILAAVAAGDAARAEEELHQHIAHFFTQALEILDEETGRRDEQRRDSVAPVGQGAT